MATLNCNNPGGGGFSNASAENGDALSEEKSLSIDYSEDLWLAEEPGNYSSHQTSTATTHSGKASVAGDISHGNSSTVVMSGTVGGTQESTSLNDVYHQQQHWNQVGEQHQQDEESGGTIIQPSTTTYINGSLEANGLEYNGNGGEEKDFAQLVPAGTYVEANPSVVVTDPAQQQNKTFAALMPVEVNGADELHSHPHPGGFTTMLQAPDGQQQMVFYGSGDQMQMQVNTADVDAANTATSHHHHQSMSLSEPNSIVATAYSQSSGQQHIAVLEAQESSAASGEDGAGEGTLYVAMDGMEQQQVAVAAGQVVSSAVLSNLVDSSQVVNDVSGQFQNISTLPFAQNGAFTSQTASYVGVGGVDGTPDGNVDGTSGVEYQDNSVVEYEHEEEQSENSAVGEGTNLTCQSCQLAFEDQASYDSHMESHPAPKSFICETCHKGFATRRYLKYHRKNHCKRAGSYEGKVEENDEAAGGADANEIKRFSCNVCNRPFRVLKCMKVHKKKKHGILKDFTCPTCAITFETAQELVDHPCQPKSPTPAVAVVSSDSASVAGVNAGVNQGQEREEVDVPSTSMSQGAVTPASSSVLQEHHHPLNTPSPNTPFMSARRKKKIRQSKPTCDICGKVFGDRISLDIHRVKHIEEEHYPCDMCAVDTSSPNNPTHLAVHFRIKFFTDDNQHILEDQKAAAEAMRGQEESPQNAHMPHGRTPISHHSLHPSHTPSPSSLHHHHRLNPASSTTPMYSNPSSIIATAAACTNIINHASGDGLSLDGQAHFLDDSNSEYVPADIAAQQQNYSVEYQQEQQQPLLDEGLAAQQQQEPKVTKTVIRSKPYICEVCNKSFAEPAKLELHYKTNHVEERPFQCTVCDKSFFTKWKLQRHMLSHLEIKPHSCPACSKSFVERGKLEAHYRTHLGTKPYKCEHCPKAFTVKSQLTIHVRRIHSADQPFGCTICGKAFLWRSGLEKHMRKHTREKPYNCNQCGQKYSQKSNLVTHMAKVHNEHAPPSTPGSSSNAPGTPGTPGNPGTPGHQQLAEHQQQELKQELEAEEGMEEEEEEEGREDLEGQGAEVAAGEGERAEASVAEVKDELAESEQLMDQSVTGTAAGAEGE